MVCRRSRPLDRYNARVLFDTAAHELLTDTPWSEARARAAIAAIVAEAEGAFDANALWPPHPLDEEEGPLPAVASLYLGAGGVIWALDELARAGAAELRRDWAPVAAGLHERYLARPDFPEITGGAPVPSLWMGEAGILLAAHRLAPERWQEERLLACVRENAANPTRELMWGSSGTMLAAAAMHARTGAAEWAEAWRESAQWLWDEWRGALWQQDLYGQAVSYLGPAHGFAGNVCALARGGLLHDAGRAELEARAVAATLAHAQRDGELAQWPPAVGSTAVRTQWCHGAPGIVASLAPIAPSDERLTDVLVAGGELTWRAGPLVKGAGLCHGTAGNGYAFLKLLERTGDEAWLDRARAFAMHAAEQVGRTRAAHGRGRYTLWTGDVGTALYLRDCLAAKAVVPTLD
jgi:Lanthionine synthetase C-like protein